MTQVVKGVDCVTSGGALVEEHGQQADIASGSEHFEPTGAGQSPPLPLEQRSVQITVAVLGMLAVAAILWSGRKTFWAETNPHRGNTPVLLLQIDINVADAREFALLPGVGPVLARRIIGDRERNGSFTSIRDLSRVHGIGPKTIDRIGVYCLPIDDPNAKVALAED